MYVLFEGIDRVGKSTQIAMLQKHFPDAIITKEPGGTELGKEIRNLVLHSHKPCALSELFLFLADRAEHIQKLIKPNLDKLIISDRGYISGIAYAHQKTKLDLKTLLELNTIAMQRTFPQKIVFFEISKEELVKRIDLEPLDNIEKRGISYLLEVQKIMKNLVISSTIPHIILDASQTKEKIFQIIADFIKE